MAGLEPNATQIRNYREFLRETNAPGVVFRGQTCDYGTLIPSFYRQDDLVNLQPLEDHANRIYLRLHVHEYELERRADLYEKGLSSVVRVVHRFPTV